MAVRVVRQCCAAPAGAEPPAQQLTPRQRRLKKQQRQHRQQKEQTQRQPPPQHQQQQLVTGAAAAVATPLPPLGCPHFNTCSGCSLSDGLHQPPVLSDAVHYFSQHGIAGFRLHAGSPHGWRRRARLAVRAGPVIGLFEEGSHAAVPIPSCVVHHPAINETAQLVQQAVMAGGIQPYDEQSGTGELRYLQLTVVGDDSGSSGSSSGAGPPASSSPGSSGNSAPPTVQLVLVWNQPPAGDHSRLAALADHLWRSGRLRGDGSQRLHSVWANYQPARTNTILGPDWRLLHGEEAAWARLGGADVCFGPGSFMQANFAAMDRCLAAMQRHVPPRSTVVDLHAGVGTIGLSLAATRAPHWVRCVEINGQGLRPFQQSAARLRQQWQAAAGGGGSSRSSSSSTTTTSAEQPPGLEYHVAAAGSDPARWCAGAQVLVCDPPRKGLEPELLDWLCSPAAAAAGARRLLYLSCGWPALKRDCAALLASGRWRLRDAESHLFFPGTDHIETLAVFDAVT